MTAAETEPAGGREAPGGRPRVAVVGAGIAGLAAARTLARSGAVEVVVFEAAGRVGGHILSEPVDGFLIEGGPDCFVSQKPAGLRLARDVGLGEEVQHTGVGSRTYVLSQGRLFALPEGVMLMVPTRFLPLARSDLLTWPGKLRMGLDLVRPRRGDQEDESLGHFVTRRLGAEALEKIAEPLVAGVHAGDPDRLSLAGTFPRFKDMEREHRSLIVAMVRARRRMAAERRRRPPDAPPSPSAFVSLRSGLTRLPERLGEELPAGSVRLGERVTAMEHSVGRYRLWVQAAGAQSPPAPGFAPYECEGVILATPAAEAAGLLQGVDAALAAELSGMEAVSAATVSLGYRREQVAHPLAGFGLVIPRRERRPIMGITWSSSKFPGRAPAGHVLLRVFVGGVKGAAVLELSDEDLLSLVRVQVEELLGARGEPVLERLYRWPGAMPQYNMGHAARLARIETALAAHPGLSLAGGPYRGIGIPDCIGSGEKAGAAVLAALKAC